MATRALIQLSLIDVFRDAQFFIWKTSGRLWSSCSLNHNISLTRSFNYIEHSELGWILMCCWLLSFIVYFSIVWSLMCDLVINVVNSNTATIKRNTKEKRRNRTHEAKVPQNNFHVSMCFQLSECTFVHLKIGMRANERRARHFSVGDFRLAFWCSLKHWLINKLPSFSTFRCFHKFLKLPEKISSIWIPMWKLLSFSFCCLFNCCWCRCNPKYVHNLFTAQTNGWLESFYLFY